ncbi:GNAT family N-acetyltransferase [Anaerovorax odorimutans]|uniref:GNAT family N-acetyltransferase n=1 Tax=Anaerovorax odorimutans TaxID=109327 RepID=UPI002ED2077D
MNKGNNAMTAKKKINYKIRNMKPCEYPRLADFLYEAIFQRDGENPAPKDIIQKPELQIYIENFGKGPDDYCLCAEAEGRLVGAVWARTIKGYGSIDDAVPELAISLYKPYRGQGIGTAMMRRMLAVLQNAGYTKVSLAVQKDNYAFNMYRLLGFQIVGENTEEYIMKYDLTAGGKTDANTGNNREAARNGVGEV